MKNIGKNWIKTGLLQVLILHGLSVREYNIVKKDLGITDENESNLIIVDSKLSEYKNLELN